MEPLTETQVADLLQPYLKAPVEEEICCKVLRYLDLLTKWRNKVNLTSIQEPEQIVQRHFGESLFLAEHLPETTQTLLDFGSGAGFPGIPVLLRKPALQVTLAESQGRKAAFLREALFELGLRAKVWSNRVEKLPAPQVFDVVALRAVDRMESALRSAIARVAPGGLLAYFAGEGTPDLPALSEWQITEATLPVSSGRLVLVSRPA